MSIFSKKVFIGVKSEILLVLMDIVCLTRISGVVNLTAIQVNAADVFDQTEVGRYFFNFRRW